MPYPRTIDDEALLMGVTTGGWTNDRSYVLLTDAQLEALATAARVPASQRRSFSKALQASFRRFQEQVPIVSDATKIATRLRAQLAQVERHTTALFDGLNTAEIDHFFQYLSLAPEHWDIQNFRSTLCGELDRLERLCAAYDIQVPRGRRSALLNLYLRQLLQQCEVACGHTISTAQFTKVARLYFSYIPTQMQQACGITSTMMSKSIRNMMDANKPKKPKR